MAQTCSIPGQAGSASIAAQPNSFFPGTGSPSAGATSLSVGAGRGVNRAIQAGDLLLIIQMQGANLNTSNSNAYGGGSSAPGVTSTVPYGAFGYAGGQSAAGLVAGNYEWAVATRGGSTFGAGGTINLSAPLVNGYFTRAGSTAQSKQAYQIVRVPQYANLTVTGGFSMLVWNGATGGVLAMDAAGAINLNGVTLDGAGRGFRGAGAVNVAANAVCTGSFNTTGCQDFVATIAAALGGSKGEGLAGTPGRLYTNDPLGTGGGTVVNGAADGYPNGEAARGAPGNAGGGGNQHNAGGGGGGGGGAGGNGGNSWNASNVTFVGLPLGGFGGAPSLSSQSRWILGGGGGAGDIGGNGTTSPDGSGGSGGGLVVLRASRIVGAGANIDVSGAPGQPSNATDAGGGGGAGGTVVIAVGAGGLSGALTVNAPGGDGGAFQAGGTAEQDGPGGGGGGGVLITNLAGITFNAPAGVEGVSDSLSCDPQAAGADCGQRPGFATAGSTGYAIVSPGVQVGYECMPNLVVTKSTSTPVITSTSGATAGYTISISNSGGGARFVNLSDNALPPGWTLAAAPTYRYNPVRPLAAGRLSSGAEAVGITAASAWSVGATPLTVPATGSTTLTWKAFAVAPVNNGTPGAVTVTFIANIPNTATVGTYHNGAGVTFLDSTRAAASTRTVAPLANVSANRTASAYSANTTYNNFNGAAATAVAGSNYSGLQGGPSGEDVRLVADFSVTKTAPATATQGFTLSYTITPRNNGRAVATRTFAITQASDVTAANLGPLLGSSPLTITDTLPTGVTTAAVFTGTGWTCVGTSPMVCTLPNAMAYPVAAGTNFSAVSGTASMAAVCSPSATPKTNTVVVSTAAGETITGNNTAIASTLENCATTTLTITKTDNTATVVSGSTIGYVIQLSNLGPFNAPGSVLTDPAATGLSCTTLTCVVSAGTAGCPSPLTISALQGVGLSIPTFNANSTLTFVLTCSVTATGS